MDRLPRHSSYSSATTPFRDHPKSSLLYQYAATSEEDNSQELYLEQSSYDDRFQMFPPSPSKIGTKKPLGYSNYKQSASREFGYEQSTTGASRQQHSYEYSMPSQPPMKRLGYVPGDPNSDPKLKLLVKEQQKSLQQLWIQEASRDQLLLLKAEKQLLCKPMMVQEVAAYRLVRFPSLAKPEEQCEDRVSANVSGLIQFLKFHGQKHPKLLKSDIGKISEALQKSQVSKRQEFKKIMISTQKLNQGGYQLQKRIEYEVAVPVLGNNWYKNHAFVSKEQISRPFKGPLYLKAAKMCIDLVQKYVLLEEFKFQTSLDGLSQQQLCFIQEQRAMKKKEQRKMLKRNTPDLLKTIEPRTRKLALPKTIQMAQFRVEQNGSLMQGGKQMQNRHFPFDPDQECPPMPFPKQLRHPTPLKQKTQLYSSVEDTRFLPNIIHSPGQLTKGGTKQVEAPSLPSIDYGWRRGSQPFPFKLESNMQ